MIPPFHDRGVFQAVSTAAVVGAFSLQNENPVGVMIGWRLADSAPLTFGALSQSGGDLRRAVQAGWNN